MVVTLSRYRQSEITGFYFRTVIYSPEILKVSAYFFLVTAAYQMSEIKFHHFFSQSFRNYCGTPVRLY